jgi:hypothetical protein
VWMSHCSAPMTHISSRMAEALTRVLYLPAHAAVHCHAGTLCRVAHAKGKRVVGVVRRRCVVQMCRDNAGMWQG